LSFSNGLIENVGIQLQAGFTAVTNSMQIRVGMMSDN
jgi:hypothetical protein